MPNEQETILDTEVITTKTFVYPNPTSNLVRVSGPSQHTVLYNASGAKIRTMVTGKNETISLHKLDPGVYYLVFENGSKQKIIKR